MKQVLPKYRKSHFKIFLELLVPSYYYYCYFRRFSNNTDLFKSLAKTVTSSPIESHWNIGGNAPIISQRLASEGWEVLLAAKMRPKTAQGIHSSIRLSTETTDDVKEDVHLIMEYGYDAVWGKYKSPRANRFIIHNDQSNMMLESLEGFHEALTNFKPHLLVIGGLQMMDNFHYDPKIRTQKLKDLQSLLESLPSSVKVHFEMASFTDEGFLKELLEYVIPYANSMGMNEQELANLHSLLKRGRVSLVTDSNPRIATSLDQGREIQSMLEHRRKGHSSSSHRKLSRLHIHTLAYQVIFTLKDSDWVHSRTATAKASLMANRHVCSSEEVNIERGKLIMDESFSVSTHPGSTRVPFTEEEPVSCWYEGPMKICIAPNIVCTAVYKTASAGDNISAAGLSVQL